MAIKAKLETKIWFRALKVLFRTIMILLLLVIIFFWYFSGTTHDVDTTMSYVLCNGTEHIVELTNLEKEYLAEYQVHYFVDGSDSQVRINKECYAAYSNKDPNYATSDEIVFFRRMQQNSDNKLYTVKNLVATTNHHWDYLLYALLIEFFIYKIVSLTGLYVFGGKEALN